MNSFLFHFLQGLSEQAINAFRVMRADGQKPSLLALNSLINAFGEDRRDAEAFSVLKYMKENVSYCPDTNLPVFLFFLVCMYSLFFHLMDVHLML